MSSSAVALPAAAAAAQATFEAYTYKERRPDADARERVQQHL